MTENQLMEVARGADLIVNGYAFTESEGRFRVLNLNDAAHAAVVTRDGEVLETSMDDIELEIVSGYLARNLDLVGD